MLGYANEEYLAPGFDFRDIYPEAERHKVEASYRRHLSGAQSDPFQAKLAAKDGREIDVLVLTTLITVGGVPAIVGTVVDLSARKEAEEALKQNEAHLRSLMQSADGFAIYRLGSDPAQPFHARVIFASPSIREIMGLEDPDDFASWFANIHNEDRSAIVAAQMASVTGGTPCDEVMRIWSVTVRLALA